MTKIALIGYMGSGKSTIARILSDKLTMDFLDLDEFIEREMKMSITEIFDRYGVIKFRKIESEMLLKVARIQDDIILSVGGGTPVYGDNMKILNQYFTTIYLRANVPTLYKRLANEKEHRPLIARVADQDLAEFIGKHLFERTAYYEQSQFIVDVNAKSAVEISTACIELI